MADEVHCQQTGANAPPGCVELHAACTVLRLCQNHAYAVVDSGGACPDTATEVHAHACSMAVAVDNWLQDHIGAMAHSQPETAGCTEQARRRKMQVAMRSGHTCSEL